MIQLNKNNINIISIVAIVVVTTFVLLFINDSKQKQKSLLKQVVINEAKQSFIDIVVARKWNAHYGGVYVKQMDGLKPNLYLMDNQTTTIDGQKLIKINHVGMTKQISKIHDKSSQVTYKITSLNPLNPDNAPNELEKKALTYFENNKNKNYYYNEDVFKDEKFNFMGKLLVEKDCLQCHAMHGYKEGEIRGGIHVTLDTEQYRNILQVINDKHFYFNLLVITFALIIIITVYKFEQIIFQQKDALEELNQSLEEKVKTRTKELNDLNENLEVKIKEAIDENKEQEELMIAQSRHAAMGEMIGMIAHQWRQPISAVAMSANNILLDIELDDIDPKNFEEMAKDILDQTQYLTKTIDDFRNFFKPGKEKTTVAPKEIIDESLAIINKSLENNGIALELQLKQTTQIKTYGRELLQVLINLLKNAKEAFENSESMTKKITIELYEDGENIFISISDNAGGIPEDIKDKIFDPYFSTKKEKNGTGLGLYMSKTIIDKHIYGKLSVENINEGAKFTLTLPKEEGKEI